eukprot:3835146-Amphidinium_carterae.1
MVGVECYFAGGETPTSNAFATQVTVQISESRHSVKDPRPPFQMAFVAGGGGGAISDLYSSRFGVGN